MEPDFASSPVPAEIALWTGFALGAVGVGCTFLLVYLRRRATVLSKKRTTIAGTLEPLLFLATENAVTSANDTDPGNGPAHITAEGDPVPELAKLKDPLAVLEMWNYLHESLDGEAKMGLNRFADQLGIPEIARSMLRSRFIDRKLLAINTLGNLGDRGAYQSVEGLINERDPIVSYWAWRALIRIDVEEALEKTLTVVLARTDWSPVFVAEMLQQIDADTLSEPLCRLVSDAFDRGIEERQMSRLVSYLTFAHIFDSASVITRIFKETNQKEVLIACLRLLPDFEPALRPRVRELVRDHRWEVRLESISTLSRFHEPEDLPLLLETLDDQEWWVRYRAAGTILDLPEFAENGIEPLINRLASNFARDMLR
ncbi:MAG TPA: HEAT repeat domain-containing protein, partial [Pyrinomonadaceae bacterium]|nr:HEAT repeat domain-containing protein [Pyrinomonadaceae bacterium]